SLLSRAPPVSTLFPYTTLFRSCRRSPSGLQVGDVAGHEPTLSVFPGADQGSRVRASPGRRSRSAGDDQRSLHPQADVEAADERRSEEHTSELQSRENLVCRLLL